MDATRTALYQRNLALVGTVSPPLAAQLDALPLTNLLCPMQPPDTPLVGCLWDVVTQQWVPLCNMQDPWGEARVDAEALYTPQTRRLVLCGAGLGYLAVELAKRLKPYQRLGLFEIDPVCFKAAMHAVDLAPLMTPQARVDTFLGATPQAVQQWMLGFQTDEKFTAAQVVRGGYTRLVNAPAYDALTHAVSEMTRYHLVGLATWNQFGRHISESDLGNLPEYCVTPGLQELKDQWQGRPAVCIAAGPSLVKNLALLLDPAVRPQLGVLTVGTTYALLRALGLTPDLVTTIDFQRLNWTDQFWRVPLDDAPPLVYLHSTYPTTVRRWPGARFVALNSSDLTGWLRQFCEPKVDAGKVQTVAHLNLVTAYLLGADPILLLGQDLAMPPAQHHALGARVQDRSPAENPEAHLELAGFDGQPVWSRHSFLSMRLVFEQLIAAHPGPRVWNCTEGGVAIAGAPNRPLREVLAEVRRTAHGRAPVGRADSLRQRAEAVARAYTPQVRWQALRRGLAQAQTDLSALQEQATAWLAAHDAYRRAVTQAPDAPDTAAQRRALLLQGGGALSQQSLAWALIAVRRFSIIERCAQLPPGDDAPQTDKDADQLERFQVGAQASAEDTPALRRLLRHTARRLATLRRSWQPKRRCGAAEVAHLLAQQHFQPAAVQLSRRATGGGGAWLARLLRLAWHRQEYGTVLGLAQTGAVSPVLVQRCRRLLERFREEHALLLPQYYAALAPETPAVPADPPALAPETEGALPSRSGEPM